MADYFYDKSDGKIHTRYSELLRCTPRQIERVVAQRNGAERFESDAMRWGTDRHEMWAQEAAKSGKMPLCFGETWHEPTTAIHIEQEFAIEFVEGVIIHMRPDLIGKTEADIFELFDYKTAISRENGNLHKVRQHYENSMQLRFYAYMLGLHNIPVDRATYLIEAWDPEHTKILQYMSVTTVMKMRELALVPAWTLEHIALLKAALQEIKA